jgi:hypothetical protein
LRGMAEKAVENARRREAISKEECGKNSSNKIFEILAEYACHKNPRRLATHSLNKAKRTSWKLYVHLQRAL